MDIRQEQFARACGDVVAIVTEHGGDGQEGFHAALASLDLDPTSTIDAAEDLASGVDSIEDPRSRGGLAFVTGMLVGVRLAHKGHHAEV